jgi:actin-like ATPase involved in cell morphogenesis
MGKFVGLDPGTGNIKMALPDGGGVKTFSIRNVFYEVPKDESSREMLKRLKAPVFEIDGRTYLAGNEAFQLATIFGKEVRRPMQSGVINAASENQSAVPMIGAMIERLLKEAGVPEGGVCGYSCPADPVDTEIDSILHKTLIESVLRRLGWTPKLILEGHAVVFSELEAEDFTGIGFSMGAGMMNVAVCFKGMPVDRKSVV